MVPYQIALDLRLDQPPHELRPRHILEEAEHYHGHRINRQDDHGVLIRSLFFSYKIDVECKGAVVARRVLTRGKSVIGRSTSLALLLGLSVLSGAVGVLNFVSQLMMFLLVLYYLISLESSGATEQVLAMLDDGRGRVVRDGGTKVESDPDEKQRA
ncbi:hypothetical protein QJS10_CPA07g00962 [Acorus calamus]|uniref:Uncharacterized protein n=1 Tax=Acorus calamus TaxID=4465 RepID=A0AAV9EGX0_ACOCL|nr:hypothetical protein QJS10_CPA07g00962 [Acorus calamus]